MNYRPKKEILTNPFKKCATCEGIDDCPELGFEIGTGIPVLPDDCIHSADFEKDIEINFKKKYK